MPIISFTFDDFPHNAYVTGGAILRDRGLVATYYASFSLAGGTGPVGQYFVRDDIPRLLADGHELGSHTFLHSHAWSTPAGQFEQSIVENQLALESLGLDAQFQSLSYPYAYPSPHNKRVAGKYFKCCRGGTLKNVNVGTADLNNLNTLFLEKAQGSIREIQRAIDITVATRGWLILATHDVADTPTRFGCTRGFFSQVVAVAKASQASILTVSQAFQHFSGESADRK